VVESSNFSVSEIDTCSLKLKIILEFWKQEWKGLLFEMQWHSKGVLHATSRRSLLHCHPRSLPSNVLQQWPVPLLHNSYRYLLRWCVPMPLLHNNVFQQWYHGFHCCATMDLVMRVAYLLKTRQADMDEAHNKLFGHARAWRTPDNTTCYLPYKQTPRCTAHCYKAY
jgi:hypothetical protein